MVRESAGSAAGALIGLGLGGPAGAVIGAAVTPAATAAVALVEAAARKRWARAEQTMAKASELAGVPVDELEARLSHLDDRLELAAQALSAAAQATLKIKADAMARAIAAISTSDGVKLEQISLVVRALDMLDGLDLRILQLVAEASDQGASPGRLERASGLPAETLRPSVRLLELHGLITDRGRLEGGNDVVWEVTDLGSLMLDLLHIEGTDADD